MNHPLLTVIAMTLLCHVQTKVFAQDNGNTAIVQIPSSYFDKISKKADGLTSKLDQTTERILSRLQKRQEKLKRKLYKTDSLAAKDIFTTADQRIKGLEQKLQNPQSLSQYIPFLDTLKSSLKFLDKNKELLAGTNGMQGRLAESMDKVKGLESQLQKAEVVKQFLKEQKQFLKDQLSRFGFAKQLGKLNKDVVYYNQQLNDYRQTLKDPQKIERKAIDLLSRTKIFQDFMKKNSMLSSLFRMPADDPNDPAYLQSLAGLQTRAQINQLVQNQIGSAGPGAMQQVQANIGQAQGALQQLKDKAAKYGSSASDDDMPDFKPNSLKTKSLFQRLEYGTNLQTQKTNSLFPVTSDIGLSVGYKIRESSIFGVGASYKMGWGENIKHIRISNQGLGLRSYIDIKYKKSLWFSGGFEINYRSLFNSLEQLRPYSAWQQSGLIGLSKKLPIKTKFFKNTKLQLLWDFLSYQQVPRTQPLVFRVGYNIN